MQISAVQVILSVFIQGFSAVKVILSALIQDFSAAQVFLSALIRFSVVQELSRSAALYREVCACQDNIIMQGPSVLKSVFLIV